MVSYMCGCNPFMCAKQCATTALICSYSGEDDVEGIDEARDIDEKGEDAIDPEVLAAALLR
jgi:hypothetical protein